MDKVNNGVLRARKSGAPLPLLTGTLIGVLITLVATGRTPAVIVAAAVAITALGIARYLSWHRRAITTQQQMLADATQELDRADAEQRDSAARMHEIRSTVAGIASATQLLKSLPDDRRESFESMVDAEIDRLMRILHNDEDEDLRPVPLDEVLGHLVTSHRARGRNVHWQASDLAAIGRYDDIAEAVNILLDNAAIHGDATDISVTATHVEDTIEITVTDNGAGVPADLRDTIFQWGAQRPDSPGKGIGLNLARTLVTEMNGDLVLDTNHHAGARFVLTIPAPSTPATSPLRLVG